MCARTTFRPLFVSRRLFGSLLHSAAAAITVSRTVFSRSQTNRSRVVARCSIYGASRTAGRVVELGRPHPFHRKRRTTIRGERSSLRPRDIARTCHLNRHVYPPAPFRIPRRTRSGPRRTRLWCTRLARTRRLSRRSWIDAVARTPPSSRRWRRDSPPNTPSRRSAPPLRSPRSRPRLRDMSAASPLWRPRSNARVSTPSSRRSRRRAAHGVGDDPTPRGTTRRAHTRDGGVSRSRTRRATRRVGRDSRASRRVEDGSRRQRRESPRESRVESRVARRFRDGRRGITRRAVRARGGAPPRGIYRCRRDVRRFSRARGVGVHLRGDGAKRRATTASLSSSTRRRRRRRGRWRSSPAGETAAGAC